MMIEPSKTRVLIIEDHAVVRQGLRRLLQDQNDIEVVADTEFGEEGVHIVRELAPDVVLLDLVLDTSRIDGMTALKQIRATSPSTHVVILSVLSDEEQVFPAMFAGAIGYVLKNSPLEEVLEAIRDAASGKYHTDPLITKKMIERLEHAHPSRNALQELLTERESEILPLLTNGMSNKEIAYKLSISTATVKTHVSNILRKLRTPDRNSIATTLKNQQVPTST